MPYELLNQYPQLENEILKSNTAHTCIWGYYSACLTILSIVTAVTQVFGTSAMPNVTNAYTKGDRGELKKSVCTPVCSMLQGVGKMNHTMVIYIFGTSLKVLVSYFFARNININIAGTAIGSLVSNLLMCVVAAFLL